MAILYICLYSNIDIEHDTRGIVIKGIQGSWEYNNIYYEMQDMQKRNFYFFSKQRILFNKMRNDPSRNHASYGSFLNEIEILSHFVLIFIRKTYNGYAIELNEFANITTSLVVQVSIANSACTTKEVFILLCNQEKDFFYTVTGRTS